jgi:hypothetical protein
MNYFTPDLLERFGSEDDRVALAAHDELEQRSVQYAEHLRAIEARLPPRFREMQERYYLHDARVVGPAFSWWHPDFLLRPFLEMVGAPPFWDSRAEEERGRWPSFLLAVQLDTPPREFLVLHYRLVRIDEVRRYRHMGDDRLPFLEWRHDEVELVPTDEPPEFGHSILFSGGYKLRLRFRDFDYATLRPMSLPPERKATAPSHPAP